MSNNSCMNNVVELMGRVQIPRIKGSKSIIWRWYSLLLRAIVILQIICFYFTQAMTLKFRFFLIFSCTQISFFSFFLFLFLSFLPILSLPFFTATLQVAAILYIGKRIGCLVKTTISHLRQENIIDALDKKLSLYSCIIFTCI